MSSDQNSFEILRPFGPRIIKSKIPDSIVNKLNDYVDHVVKDKKKSNELNVGNLLAGNVTQEFSLEKDFIIGSGWGDFLGQVVSQSIKGLMKKQIKKFHINSSWIVRQFENEYNPLHNHSGHLSGVGYLKVPESFGGTSQDKGDRRNKNGKLVFAHGNQNFLSSALESVTPKVGEVFIFPSYLLHLVNPFYDTKEERRSVSFNALIDDDIYKN